MGVHLGRFAPYHIGHSNVTKAMIEKHGIKNSLVMIGSSNALNSRTPFTYEQRKEMVNNVFPMVNVIPLPDVKPELIQFDGSSNKVWLKQLMKFEDQYNADFVFYGGSVEDLKVLGIIFETEVIIDRSEGLQLSATKVRQAIKNNDFEVLNMQLGEQIAQLALTAISVNAIPL